MNVVVYEDAAVANLHPITLGRPAYAVSSGSVRLVDLLLEWGQPLLGIVRPHLRAIQQADFSELSSEGPRQSSTPTLLVNARLAPSYQIATELRGRSEAGQLGTAMVDGQVAAALLPAAAGIPSANDIAAGLSGYLKQSLPAGSSRWDLGASLFDFPHEIVAHHERKLLENLHQRVKRGDYREIADGVFTADGALLGQYVVCDTSEGPIVLETDSVVESYSYLCGPLHVGAAARIRAHSTIKGRVALGHTTRVGGEVQASIFEPYSNKQHFGFLGHCYVGSCVNLGAGTSNSNLKNTYGQINVSYGGQQIATGMDFLGCILGDYVKTAIHTGLFSGKTIGAGSMLYGLVTENVPDFVNYARQFGDVTETDPETVILAQRRMLARRDVEQRECDRRLIRDMFDLTTSERQGLENRPPRFT